MASSNTSVQSGKKVITSARHMQQRDAAVDSKLFGILEHIFTNMVTYNKFKMAKITY